MPDTDFVWIRRIGSAQASIITGPGHQCVCLWDHPHPIVGRQQRVMHHGSGTLQRGDVKPPLEDHTHQGGEGKERG